MTTQTKHLSAGALKSVRFGSPRSEKARPKLRKAAESLGVYLLIGLGLVFMLIPVVWLLSTSLKTRAEMFNFPLHLIPRRVIFSNYIEIWEAIPFAAYIKNSLLIASYSTIVALVFATLAAYAFSRHTFRFKPALLLFILFSQMFPSVLLIIPMFIYIKTLGLLGSMTGLMIVYMTFLLPLSTWALKNFFDTIPTDLEEAARIDGCSQLGALFRVILPVSLPGLIAVATYCFITAWNEYLFAMVFMNSQRGWTLPVGLAALTSQFALDWGLLTAGGVISLFPAIVVMVFLQRYLISGLLAGAVKE